MSKHGSFIITMIICKQNKNIKQLLQVTLS